MDVLGYMIVGVVVGIFNIVGEKWGDEGYLFLLFFGKFKKLREEFFII